MALETATPLKKRQSPGSKNTAGLDLDELRQLWLKPLWLVLSDAFTAEPNTQIVPHIWKWSDVRPRILEAGRRISAEEAERRVLMYLNPGLNGAPGATQTLFSGIQLIMPGEIAPTHRHVPSALRVVVEGNGAYTTVSGEKTLMRPGDFVTTPNWAWHDHGNDTDQPMMWLDGLDMPFVLALNAMFYEEYFPVTGQDIQPVVKELEDSQGRYNRGFRPHRDRFSADYSPILNYRYDDVRETLDLMVRAGDATSEEEGVMLDYINPLTGGPTLPTIDSHAQLIRPGEHTRAVRDTASRIYHVLDGQGTSVIGGKRLDWQKGDTFCAPTWAWREHQVAERDGPGVLFSFDDAPIQKPFSLYRRQTLMEGTGHQSDL
ncbi:MAG TPA: cupin domain-containing protein [Chloroflexota bacterium]